MSLHLSFDDFFDDFKDEKGAFPTIIDFAESKWGWNQKLFPVQKFIFKLIYGLPLDNSERTIRITDKFNEKEYDKFSEKRYFKFLKEEGRINISEPRDKPFFEILKAIGRRGTKSSMSSILGGYELYYLQESVKDPHTHFKIANTDEIRVTIVSNTKSQASLIYNQIKEGSMSSEVLSKYLAGEPSVDRVRFYTNAQLARYKQDNINPKTRKGLLSVFVGVSNSRNARGPGTIVLVMDEFAFFLDTNSAISDKAVYDALTPSVAAFGTQGKIVLISSPLSKSGMFYEIYSQGMGDGGEPPDEDLLVLRIPTWGINPNIDADYLKSRFKRLGKTSFGCEFGANFSDSKSAWLEDENMLLQCVDENYQKPKYGTKYQRFFWGIDQGQSSDAFALAVTHKERDITVVDYMKDYFGKKEECIHRVPDDYYEFTKRPIKFPQDYEDLVAELKEVQKRFPIQYGMMDQWSGTLFNQIFEKNGIRGLEVVHFTDSLNSEMYHLWFYLMGNKQFKTYDEEYFIRMMLLLEKEVRSKNITIVQAPQRKGFHDDLADAVARAIYAAHKLTKKGTGSNIITAPVMAQQMSYEYNQLYKQRIHQTNPRGGGRR